jgi:hypothetical protein
MVRVALQAELFMLFLAIDEAKVADIVLRDVSLSRVLLAHVISHARLERLSVNKDELLREKWKVTRDDGIP